MFKTNKPAKTTIQRTEQYKGETIEQKIRRVTNNKEPITDGAPLVYTDRKDGVLPEYNPRADRWEEAIGATDLIQKQAIVKRMERHFPEQKNDGQEAGDAGKAAE
jgi:hypothetical protein